LDDRAHPADRGAGADRDGHAPVAYCMRRVHGGDLPGRRRRRAVEPDGVRRADERLTAATGLPDDVCAGMHADGPDMPGRGMSGRGDVRHGRNTPAAARGRDAADVRPEAPRAYRTRDSPPGEQRRVTRRDARVDRAAELRLEGHVEVPVRELGVEAADDEALRARELVLDDRTRN